MISLYEKKERNHYGEDVKNYYLGLAVAPATWYNILKGYEDILSAFYIVDYAVGRMSEEIVKGVEIFYV